MSLSLEEIQRIANLSKLAFDESQSLAMQSKINSFFQLVEQMDSVNTDGVEPLFHPVSVVQDIALRLQDDVADTGNHRAGNMQNAPAAENGYFLVPKVIE